MVNMKVDKGNLNLGISGELTDIVAEIVYGIDKIHDKIKETNEESGNAFEGLLMLGLCKVFRPKEADDLVKELKKLTEQEEDDEEDDDEDDDVLDDIIELLTKIKGTK